MAADYRPWLGHYDAGVPATLAPYPSRTLLDYVATPPPSAPTTRPLLFKGARLSYGDLERQSDAFAAALTALGVRRGDRVALVLPNCPQFVIAELGIWKAGAVAFPLNPLYTSRELGEPLADSGAEIAVVLTPFYARVKECQPRTSVKRVIATNIKEYLPPHLRLLFSLFTERKAGHRIAIERGDFWFQDLLRTHAGAPRPASLPGPEDPAVLLMSGGTTGTPKGVIGLHRCLVAAGLQLHAWLAPGSIDWNDIIMLPLPLFHVYACVGVQSYAFVGHNPLALVPNPRDLDDVLRTVERVRPSFIGAVPTLLAALLNHPRVAARKVDFSSIKICFSGAAPLLAETKQRFEELTGGRIVEGYSLTEAMMACAANPLNGPGRAGSVGLPLPDVEIAIVDSDTGRTPLPPGEVGEIIMRAPQLMAGYWGRPAETTQALRPREGQGAWLHTGDLGYDERGRLSLHRRSQEGPDQDERLPGVAARDRGGHRRAPGRGRGRRRRRAGRRQGRGRQGLDRLPAGPVVDGGRHACLLPAAPRPLQGAGAGRIPDRAAQDDDGQGAEAGAGRRGRQPHARHRMA